MNAIVDKKKIRLNTNKQTLLGDVHTPVSLFLKLRDEFKQVILLESNDFTSKENCRSFIAIDILAEIFVRNKTCFHRNVNGEINQFSLTNKEDLSKSLEEFITNIHSSQPDIFNGLFGHTDFECTQYFESIQLNGNKKSLDKPELRYSLFRFIIEFDHFKDELSLIENIPENQKSQIEKLKSIIQKPVFSTFKFKLEGEVKSNMQDNDFKELVKKGKSHCKQGNVFQIVFSRQFIQGFSGDDFNVYRVCLLYTSPSPRDATLSRMPSSA